MFPFTETLQTFENFPRIEAQVCARWDAAACISSISRYNSSTKCILASMPCWVTHGGHGGIPRQLNYAGQASRISNTLRGSYAPNRPFSWTSGICIGPLVCAQDKGEPWNLCCKYIIQHSMSLINVTSPGEHLLNSKILDQDVH